MPWLIAGLVGGLWATGKTDGIATGLKWLGAIIALGIGLKLAGVI